MNKKKLDVHMVQHTHWDREWYFTSDDSRTMLYYDVKFLIEYLEKNDDVFTFDGQSSIIDDFLKFSPDWKDRFSKVVKDKKLLVGPFYTQIDNVIATGESIIRNIEVGNHIAKKIGHSMQVGYLPDTFGHNNQTPQILKLNGINNFSFYRGLDPKDTNDELYFNYEGQDGTKILGHWQTHYSTKGEAFEYTTKAFEKNVVADYPKKGLFYPSVKSYAKRNKKLPITIPIGSDQKPFRKEVKQILKELNKQYKDFNFIVSDYETALKAIAKQIKEENINLLTVFGELRQALTGRVHRSILSSRMDIKQLLFKLETILIDVLEPFSIMCLLNNIDVPWKIITHVWKELFKSSAHDSYGTTNEDIVNLKLKSRINNGIRVARGVIAMLSRIFANKIINEKKDAYNKIIVFNFTSYDYSGLYKFECNVQKGFEKGYFKILEDAQSLPYTILKTSSIQTNGRKALLLAFSIKNISPFSYKILDIEYTKTNQYIVTQDNKIGNSELSIEIKQDKIIVIKNGRKYDKLIRIMADSSVGDTYDHSPITFNDKKYFLNNYKIIVTNLKSKTIKFDVYAKLPNGIQEWKNNTPSIEQKLSIQLTIFDNKIHGKIFVKNSSKNARLILLIDSLSNSNDWYHDQQFGIYKRTLINAYMKDWHKKDKLGYKWEEYPTNLSPHQWFISNNESNLTIYTFGTKEHEMIKLANKNFFAITLYRAFGKFGTKHVVYRPGRVSGAPIDAPDCQLLNDVLEYDFIIDINKTSIYDQFKSSQWLKEKNYYIPAEWGADRTILRWDTDINYYDKDKNKRSAYLQIPKDILDNKFLMTSLYKDSNNNIIARYLNVDQKMKIQSKTQKTSRDLFNFNFQDVIVPKFGLINVLIKEK